MSKAICGKIEYPLSEQVQDTIRAHGFVWSWNYYVDGGRLSFYEFKIFAGPLLKAAMDLKEL